VVKDQVDPQKDERLAKFVVESHHQSHPSNAVDELDRAVMGAAAPPASQQGDTIDQNLLKLYIAYAKQNCHPKLQNADTNKMVQVCPSIVFSRGASITEMARNAAMFS
jgi:DNA replication licensing factor MCM2